MKIDEEFKIDARRVAEQLGVLERNNAQWEAVKSIRGAFYFLANDRVFSMRRLQELVDTIEKYVKEQGPYANEAVVAFKFKHQSIFDSIMAASPEDPPEALKEDSNPFSTSRRPPNPGTNGRNGR